MVGQLLMSHMSGPVAHASMVHVLHQTSPEIQDLDPGGTKRWVMSVSSASN